MQGPYLLDHFGCSPISHGPQYARLFVFRASVREGPVLEAGLYAVSDPVASGWFDYQEEPDEQANRCYVPFLVVSSLEEWELLPQ